MEGRNVTEEVKILSTTQKVWVQLFLHSTFCYLILTQVNLGFLP